jgi:hypothetical protein
MGGARNLTPQPSEVWTHDYCRTHALYVQRRPGEPDVPNDKITYLVLSGWAGGRIHITEPDEERGLLINYAKDMFEGCKKLSYVQMRTPYFKFFMDIDVRRSLENGPASTGQMRQLVDIALAAIAEFVPGASAMAWTGAAPADPTTLMIPDASPAPDLTAYVCDTLPSFGPDLIKCGCHLHVPALVVDVHTARMIRGLIVQRATDALGNDSPFANSTDDIYDEVVYLSNGIRMVGSVKYSICKTCRRGNGDCPDCGGFGRLIDMVEVCEGTTRERRQRVYGLSTVLRWDGRSHVDDPVELARLTAHSTAATLSLVHTMSIRSPESTEVVPWLKIPVYAEMPRLAIIPTKRAAKGRPPKVFDIYPEDAAGLNRQLSDFTEVENAETLALLSRVLAEVLVPEDPRRTGVRLKRARSRPGMYMLYVIGPGSTLCGNMPGDGMHRSNSIYFVVTPAGAEQRCFCSCVGVEAKRLTGVLCKTYRSRKSKLSPDLRTALFPLETLERERERDLRRWERAAATRERTRLPAVSVAPTESDDLPRPAKRACVSRPPSALHKRSRTDPRGQRQARHYQYKMFGLAVQEALSRGPPAQRTRARRIEI